MFCLTSGTTTRQKLVQSEAPSIRAASSSSFGTLYIAWRIRKTPNGLIIHGMIMPQ